MTEFNIFDNIFTTFGNIFIIFDNSYTNIMFYWMYSNLIMFYRFYNMITIFDNILVLMFYCVWHWFCNVWQCLCILLCLVVLSHKSPNAWNAAWRVITSHVLFNKCLIYVFDELSYLMYLINIWWINKCDNHKVNINFLVLNYNINCSRFIATCSHHSLYLVYSK